MCTQTSLVVSCQAVISITITILCPICEIANTNVRFHRQNEM